MARKRGCHDESDVRMLVEKIKGLEKQLRSLERENKRLRKEMNRAGPQEEPDEEVTPKKAPKRPYQPYDTDQCPKCLSYETRSFTLPSPRGDVKYVSCGSCGKRSRINVSVDT